MKEEKDYTLEDLKFLGKTYFEDILAKSWSYDYHLKINIASPKLEFTDGEIEETYWFSVEEINKMIENNEKITKDSIVIYNKFLKRE